jgi:hypothetical protein
VTGKSAGNIDVVLVAYDDLGKVTDFAALEIQAVYISGNVRRPFDFYMADPKSNKNFDWSKQPGYPNPDYLSSSRKRLAPQLIYKGGIFNEWKKKSAVALQRDFFETLPTLPQVKPELANLAWFIYDLERNARSNTFELKLTQTVYTDFGPALERITRPQAGPIQDFIEILQDKLDQKLDGVSAPDAPSLQDILSESKNSGD